MERNAWLFRGTNRVRGRKRIIDETSSGLKFLRYGRIVLDGDDIVVAAEEEEVAFMCLGGSGIIRTGGGSYSLGKYDTLYLPRDSECIITSENFFDLAEIAALSSKRYPIQLVQFEDVLRDEKLVRRAGFSPYSRTLHTILGESNVQASRLLVGYTVSDDGNWTSWPPHDHSELKEEIYLYVDMPKPSFGIHLNYTDYEEMEMVTPVWEGDAVAIKKGYHYNVATPGTRISFVWMMAAIREDTGRIFSTCSIQPEFGGDRFKLF